MQDIFGTDGIRCPVGSFPLTREHLPDLGYALGSWIVQKYGKQAQVLVGSDTRNSCDFIKAGLKLGLLSHPVTLFDAGILPTPGLFHLIKQSEFQCAIMISASHNGYEDNGIKIIDAHEGKLSPEDQKIITQLLSMPEQSRYTDFGTDRSYPAAQDEYAKLVTGFFEPGILQNFKIVLDVAHGATYRCAPEIFKTLGADVVVVNDTPTGKNINHACGALYPEKLQQAVIDHKATIGFAFDGDGDRVLAVNNAGIIKNGDDLLALLSQHPEYAQSQSFVGTIMSNQGLEIYFRKQQKRFVRSAVGDSYVLEALIQEDGLLGGEQSGHIILRNAIATGDGILVALKVMQTMLLTHNETLETFTKFPQISLNLPIKIKKNLTQAPLSTLIDDCKQKLPTGRLVVRYSGTEPLLRLMIEDQDEAHATQVIQELCHCLTVLLD